MQDEHLWLTTLATRCAWILDTALRIADALISRGVNVTKAKPVPRRSVSHALKRFPITQ